MKWKSEGMGVYKLAIHFTILRSNGKSIGIGIWVLASIVTGFVIVAREVKVAAEQFESDDGIDDDDEQYEQGDVKQRNHRLDDGIQYNLQTCQTYAHL